jgi:hypothetical protein
LVGLQYTPYLVVLLVLHLTAPARLRMVMRRSGVDAWLATLTASVFVYLGAGAQDILSASQMTVVGSIVFGLTDLLLADHDGPLDRRDALAVLVTSASWMGARGVRRVGAEPR